MKSFLQKKGRGSVECSPGVDKAQGDYPALRKLGNSTAPEVEAGDSEVQGHGGQPSVLDQLGIHETLSLEKRKRSHVKQTN